jgi:two-component system, OmpR family, alkaline phosphatase synthesis response regulator PhoP
MRTNFILVADTRDEFLANLREQLASTQYALLHAKDGQEAMDYLELLKNEIAVAIIQLELPGMSGLDVIWQLARRRQPKPTKIIATSCGNAPLLEHVVKELGVAAVIRDPTGIETWPNLIESVLDGSSKNGISRRANGSGSSSAA